MSEYKYLINDFTSQKVGFDRLIDEISNLSISKSLSYINADESECSLTFSGTLSSEELATLI